MLKMFCKQCGVELPEGAAFCTSCGTNQSDSVIQTKAEMPVPGKVCPKCGSTDVEIQMHQETTGSTTVTKSKSKYKEKGHGCLWWLCIGWWWWIIDLCLWICAFIPRLLVKVFKKKKYKGKSTSVAHTENHVVYKSVCLCKNCGNHWELPQQDAK